MINVKSIQLGELGNNCYLITDEATGSSALVDCTDASQKMLDFIGDADLKYILLTHGHFDHIGGVAEIKQKYGAKVAISEEDSGMLTSGKASLAAFCGINQQNSSADVIVGEGSDYTWKNKNFGYFNTRPHKRRCVLYCR